MHLCDTFTPGHKSSLTKDVWKRVCEEMNQQEKKDNSIKDKPLADCGQQEDCLSEEGMVSPMVSMEVLLLTGIMEAKKH